MKIGIILYSLLVFHGAFEYKSGNPGSLFPWQIAVHDCTSPAVMGTPALLPLADGLLLNSSAGRPYSEEALSTGSLTVQYGYGGYGLQGSWNSFGADFYREHTFSLMGGYSILPFLQAGISGNIYMLKIDTDELSLDEKYADTDIAFIITPFPWISGAFIQKGVISLFSRQNSSVIYPERSAGILLKPGRGFSLAWNITDTAAGKVNTFAATINPAPFFSISGGYCRENSSLAASFGVSAAELLVSYGLRFHPFLGYTHSLGITFALNLQIESLDYGKPLFRRNKKRINIKSASPDDLKEIDGLTALSAERVILYREKIGPVNEKALVQIGLTGEEIKNFESSVYGLERSGNNRGKEKEYKKFRKKAPRRERIKHKFRSLISGGIKAYTAITYSELSESAERELFYRKLNDDSSLTDEQKKFIKTTCSE